MAPKKILIVDDDPDFIEITKTVLESNQFSVVTASGPDEGFDKVAEEHPDLIILDVMWPDKKSGFDVCRELKNKADSKNIPIVMLTSVDKITGLGFEKVAGDDTWLPSDGFLSKPVKPDVLLAKIKELL